MGLLSHFESKLTYAILVAAIPIITILYFKFLAQPTKRLAPGSFGFPIIGETISFLRAHKHNKTGEWFQDRIDKFGPVFKTSLLFKKTIVLTGQAGNKFIFSSTELRSHQPQHIAKLMGKKSILGLSGSEHKHVRSVITSLLNLGSIKEYVSPMNSIVEQQILQELHGRDSVKMVEIMKKISFKVTCGLLFKIPDGKEKDALYEDFKLFAKGLSSFPIIIPVGTYYKALQARSRICKILSDVMRKRKNEIENGKLGHDDNIISCFLNQRDENGDHFTETTILDNLVSLLFASYDTSTTLLCNLVRKLARSSEVYSKVLQEQMEVVKACKERDGKLTWNEIQMMKYTWMVAQELLRISPPVSGTVRTTAINTTFGVFDIPKGWQVHWVTCTTHMDKNIFEEPEHFNPARFDSQTKSSFPPYTYIPFGGGPRICPGSDFARIEVLLIMHHLVTNYSWTEIIRNEPIRTDPMPYPAMGLPVKLNPKKQAMVA